MPFNIVPLTGESLAKLQSISAMYTSLESILDAQADSHEKYQAITYLKQSFMWLQAALEREQLERNFRSGQSMPIRSEPTATKVADPLSPDASVLAESRAKIDSLKTSLQELTDIVAITGFPIKG